MCYKNILENVEKLMFVSECNKTQKRCNKVVGNDVHVPEFAFNCYRTIKIV